MQFALDEISTDFNLYVIKHQTFCRSEDRT